MKVTSLIIMSVAAIIMTASAQDAAADKVKVDFGKVKPCYTGTPKDIAGLKNLEAPRKGRPRDAIYVPAGCNNLLSKGAKVTSSDEEPIIGDLTLITDGVKEHGADTYVELGPMKQWIQIDLGAEKTVYAVNVWHYHGEGRVYRNVVIQISNDPDFIDGVVTVFNNDAEDVLKLGKGKDKEYIEDFEGRPVAVNAVKGRYVRFYSNGNTSNEMNHYTEAEVYGK